MSKEKYTIGNHRVVAVDGTPALTFPPGIDPWGVRFSYSSPATWPT